MPNLLAFMRRRLSSNSTSKTRGGHFFLLVLTLRANIKYVKEKRKRWKLSKVSRVNRMICICWCQWNPTINDCTQRWQKLMFEMFCLSLSPSKLFDSVVRHTREPQGWKKFSLCLTFLSRASMREVCYLLKNIYPYLICDVCVGCCRWMMFTHPLWIFETSCLLLFSYFFSPLFIWVSLNFFRFCLRSLRNTAQKQRHKFFRSHKFFDILLGRLKLFHVYREEIRRKKSFRQRSIIFIMIRCCVKLYNVCMYVLQEFIQV